MASGYVITRVWGIPIKLHISLILLLPFFLVQMTGMGLGLLESIFAITLLFGSVALHELGHSKAAHYFGYRVREILLLPIGGVAMLEELPRKPIEELIIAIAGPAVSLLLGVATLVFASAGGLFGLVRLSQIFTIAMIVNIMLCLFNLIPAFPMDGGRIFRALMTPRTGRLRATYLAAKTGRFTAVIFGLLALFIIRPFSFSLLLIAAFIYYAAGVEYRGLLVREQLKNDHVFGMPPRYSNPAEADHEFSVGPAPYARGADTWNSGRIRSWFNDLFIDYDN